MPNAKEKEREASKDEKIEKLLRAQKKLGEKYVALLRQNRELDSKLKQLSDSKEAPAKVLS